MLRTESLTRFVLDTLSTVPGRIVTLGGKIKYVYMPAGFEEILEGKLYRANKGGIYCLPEAGTVWLFAGSISTVSATIINPIVKRMSHVQRDELYNSLLLVAWRKAA